MGSRRKVNIRKNVTPWGRTKMAVGAGKIMDGKTNKQQTVL